MPTDEELAHIFREGAMSDGSWWDALGLKAVWDAAHSAALEEAAQEAEKARDELAKDFNILLATLRPAKRARFLRILNEDKSSATDKETK